MEKPQNCTEEHLEYLDELRDSGITNMYGARPYLKDDFPELTDKEAGAILYYWMDTFPERYNRYGKAFKFGY